MTAIADMPVRRVIPLATIEIPPAGVTLDIDKNSDKRIPVRVCVSCHETGDSLVMQIPFVQAHQLLYGMIKDIAAKVREFSRVSPLYFRLSDWLARIETLAEIAGEPPNDTAKREVTVELHY